MSTLVLVWRTLLMACVLYVCAGCEPDARQTRLPMDVSDLSPIQPQLDQLPKDESDLVVAYLKRSNGDYLTPQFADPDEPFTARTFAEAIVLQRDFLAKQQVWDAATEARRAEREAKLQPLRDVLKLDLVRRELLTYDQIYGNTSLPPMGGAKVARSGNSERLILVLTYRLSNRSSKTMTAFSGAAEIPGTGLTKIAQCWIDEHGELAAGATREVRCGDPRMEADESQRRVLTQPLAALGLRWEPREIRFVDGSLLKGPL